MKQEEYILKIGQGQHAMEFVKKTIYGKTGEGAKGTEYTLNRKIFKDIESLSRHKVEEVMEDVLIYEDAYGNKVLYCYTSIPTFDFADREWDSMVGEYLMYDGQYVNLVVCRGGYKMASLTLYEHLLAADSGLQAYFSRLGYPVETIRWL